MVEIHSHARPPGPFSTFGLGIAGTVIVVDQVAKLIVQARLPEGWAIDVLPILTLLRVRNTGIAFSMFAGSGIRLVLLTLLITVLVIVFWARSREGGRVAGAGFALIVGGAIGNLIDRLSTGQSGGSLLDRLNTGYVTDFLLLHFGSWTLFVFNLADAALTLGPALLLLVYLWPAKPDAQRQEPRQDN